MTDVKNNSHLSGAPLISIGVSTYNRKKLLAESLRSLQAQTYKNFEIIVIDDGSSDGTCDMMKNDFPEITYIYQENQGDAAAKNNAAAHARGEFIVFNDSDDLFMSDTLEKLYYAIKKHPGACSYGNYITIDAAGNSMPTKAKMKKFPSGKIISALIDHIVVNNCGTLMPIGLFRQLGGYDVKLRCAYDYKFALNMALIADFYAVSSPVFFRRRHNSNISAASYAKLNVIMGVLEEFFANHPEIARKYPDKVKRRYADIHGKLAKLAGKESLSNPLVQTHLKAALHYHFSFKNFFRYLLTIGR